MSRNNPRNSKPARTAPSSATSARADWAMMIVALLGVIVTAILMWSASTDAALPYCDAGSGCDVVQSSAWSRFLGLPLALWGLMTYSALGVVAVAGRGATHRARWTALLATAGFAISVYLSLVSVFAIKALCAYCLASLALMCAAFGLSFRAAAAGMLRWRVAGAVFATLIAVLMHGGALGFFSGSGGKADPYLRELAQHLDARGIKFYGAYWCSHCQQQKELFGAAAAYLPYVECAPHGPKGPRATTCAMLEIKAYPTWMVDGRRFERVMTAPMLATLSGFRPPAPATPTP